MVALPGAGTTFPPGETQLQLPESGAPCLATPGVGGLPVSTAPNMHWQFILF